jgi:hypothetical protein
LTTIAVIFLLWTPTAYAWSWPVQGPVIAPFAYDEAHPYAAGQHRGVDIGADSAGTPVVAPAAGTVSFAGTVASNGKSVTIETADGYSVTLTHLGSIVVARGATVAEQDTVGTVGPSGTPEVDGPYVHLGIRLTADSNGYVDPVGLLPAESDGGADESGSATPSQPASTVAGSAPPVKPAAPASSRPRPATNGRGRVRAHQHQSAQESRSDGRTTRSAHRPVRAKEVTQPRVERGSATVRTSSFRRPLAEPATPQARPSENVRPRRVPSSPLLALLCNWAAALFGLVAVLVARKRRPNMVSAEILHLPPKDELRRVSRAA